MSDIETCEWCDGPADEQYPDLITAHIRCARANMRADCIAEGWLSPEAAKTSADAWARVTEESRTLRRERDEARRQVDTMIELHDDLERDRDRVQQERDAARESCQRESIALDGMRARIAELEIDIFEESTRSARLRGQVSAFRGLLRRVLDEGALKVQAWPLLNDIGNALAEPAPNAREILESSRVVEKTWIFDPAAESLTPTPAPVAGEPLFAWHRADRCIGPEVVARVRERLATLEPGKHRQLGGIPPRDSCAAEDCYCHCCVALVCLALLPQPSGAGAGEA